MEKIEIQFKPQNQFPYLHDFLIRFPIDDGTIFPYGDTIYFNGKEEDIPYDIMIHERYHCKSQLEYGVEKWIQRYLNDVAFRQKEEIGAYRYQLMEVKRLTKNDREELTNIRNEIIRNLTSGLYGDIDVPEAIKSLKI